eukprot:4091296-Amphidinium_carterae.1
MADKVQKTRMLMALLGRWRWYSFWFRQHRPMTSQQWSSPPGAGLASGTSSAPNSQRNCPLSP